MHLRLLLVCVLAPLVLWAASPLVSAGAPTAAQQAQVAKQLHRTRTKIARKKGTERVLTSEISGYSRRIDRLQGRIGTLQERENAIQSDLDAKRAELVRVQDRLRSERARLVALRVRLVQGRRTLAARLVDLYKADQPDLMTVVLNAKGFADLLERGDFLKRISDSDRNVVAVVKRARTDAVATTRRLAGLERRRRAVAAAILARRQEVSQVKMTLVGTRVGYDRTKGDKQRALSKTQGDRQTLEHHESVLESKQREIESALARVSGSPEAAGLPDQPVKRGSGAFVWPVNGPITSPFCERRAWEACHPGIDIGVPGGTPIHATAAGKVVLMQGEAQSGGYGNFTCIQHTATISSCYAHQSAFKTSLGAKVRQGQVIGLVGCTGRCFGDHLHFEIRVNGQVVNPVNYL